MKYALGCIIIVFLLPELLLWGKVDSFQEPLRSYRGDTAHYMTVLNGALERGPESNTFLNNEENGVSRFFVFQSIVWTAGQMTGVSASVLAIILQVLVPLLVFLILFSLFKKFRVKKEVAMAVSLIHTLVYGVVVYDGYGLAFWFIPFLLFGLWVIVNVVEKEIFTGREGFSLAFSILLFTLHPAYFAFGGALTAVAWFMLIRQHGWRRVAPYIGLWLALAIVLFFSLFASGLSASIASQDTLVRMALVKTRFPIHPLTMLELLLVGIATFSRRRFDIVSAAFFIGFLALLAPTITGSYLVNDHYVIAHDYLILAAALTLVYSDRVEKRVWLGGLLLVATILDIFLVLNYFNFKIGYYGKYATIHAAYLIIAFVLLRPEWKEKVRQALGSKKVRTALICAALAYALLLQYKDTVNAHLARDTEIQTLRPLIENLRALPPGVIMADNDLSFFLPIFTPHKIYWSTLASSHPAPTENILNRFKDADLVFPNDPTHQSPAVVGAVFGAINKCDEFYRGAILKKLANFGLESPYQQICAPTLERQAQYDAIKDSLAIERNQAMASQIWAPAFQLDYLVIGDKDTVVPAWVIQKYFSKIATVQGYEIYQYNGK